MTRALLPPARENFLVQLHASESRTLGRRDAEVNQTYLESRKEASSDQVLHQLRRFKF